MEKHLTEKDKQKRLDPPSNGSFLKEHVIIKVTQEVHYAIPKYMFGADSREELMEEWFVEFDGRVHASKDYCKIGGAVKTISWEQVKEIK